MNKNDLISTRDFVNYVKELIQLDYGGSQKQFAQDNNLSEAYVSDILLNRKEPGKKFLAAIGAERIICYRLL